MNPAAPSPCRYFASLGSRCSLPAVMHGYCRTCWPAVRQEAWDIQVGIVLRSALSVRDAARRSLAIARYEADHTRYASGWRYLAEAARDTERARALAGEARRQAEAFRREFPRTVEEVALRCASPGWRKSTHTELRRRARAQEVRP